MKSNKGKILTSNMALKLDEMATNDIKEIFAGK